MLHDVENADRIYTPTFFNSGEWAFVVAASDRLIPADAIGPGAVELGVPEFIDRHMHTPYAAGATWYLEGPFREAAPEFGYQGGLPLRDMLTVGIRLTNTICETQPAGKAFADLIPADQEAVLAGLECGEIELAGIPSKQFFAHFLAEVRAGYFADPSHGGNRAMGSWKMIGYPGLRRDYRDAIGTRDRAYDQEPVSLRDLAN